MKVLGICCISIGILLIFISLFLFVIYKIFEKGKGTEKAIATLKTKKNKKNVPVYGKNTPGGPIRIVMIIKNWTKGIYEYTVNNKKYIIHYTDYISPDNISHIVTVIYLKRFPKIAYVKTDADTHNFDVLSIATSLVSIFFIILGVLAIV